ncbi:hypothetical protein EUGRSUZ_I01728 [Eucalyptus grandis]|uniref:Uncharacterized protein n=2 Tax=Eucalyptus grandis TaxID=71139 RepID=A0ACC3JGH7_EUCGR|nr:hypothetical protein EUGRSUZ_I01728 [Eucalyptus grandis]
MGFWGVLVPWLLVVALACSFSSWVLRVEADDALPDCRFPAMYNFGDSNSDTGGISAAFDPIPSPYGAGFFHKPAGRDCDGRLIVDFIAEKLKLPYLSAYLNSLGTNYRHGANFATGGSTIRRQNETIFEFGISPFSLDMQIVQYDQFKRRTAELYSQAKDASEKSKLPVQEEFAQALYTFDIGQNDLSVGFRKLSSDQLKAALPDIVNKLASAVQNIYRNGGRSFWIHNTGPIGCLPVNFFYNHNPPAGYLDDHGCVKTQNEMAVEFNRQLKERVIKLRQELPEAAITYVDVYAAKFGLIGNYKSEGKDLLTPSRFAVDIMRITTISGAEIKGVSTAPTFLVALARILLLLSAGTGSIIPRPQTTGSPIAYSMVRCLIHQFQSLKHVTGIRVHVRCTRYSDYGNKRVKKLPELR